jgi:hypothetical protein
MRIPCGLGSVHQLVDARRSARGQQLVHGATLGDGGSSWTARCSGTAAARGRTAWRSGPAAAARGRESALGARGASPWTARHSGPRRSWTAAAARPTSRRSGQGWRQLANGSLGGAVRQR